MRSSQQRLWLFGAIAIGALILLTLIAAPANNKLNSGSTYGRTPDGYGAWYAFMSERGTPVQRWQKPFEDLAKNQNPEGPITLLRVHSELTANNIYDVEQDWVEKGNTLVILGVKQPVTEAAFSTTHQAGELNVKIDTQRRKGDVQGQRLGDRFGAIVWQESIGKGQVFFATTPHLAANAYQDFRGNYEFLAQLVTQSGTGETRASQNSLWVDEYIHGYKDKDVDGIEGEQQQTILTYLANTPLFPAFIQGLILLLVAIWAALRRFGQPSTLSTPVVDNSEAYIQALAGVLQKADSSEFILEVVGKEEQLQLQKALLLGQATLDPQSLVNAWVQQTGRPATELEQVLQVHSRKRRLSESELLIWLGKWEKIRRHLPS